MRSWAGFRALSAAIGMTVEDAVRAFGQNAGAVWEHHGAGLPPVPL
jgi:hypothetical protein